ncbi:MAG UNVERIFIED_CONTAM: hypothetical protein LVR29_30620 [Microcystis novacekii LVE1205-3]|jgi:ribosome-binding ATPase YchF (GTP1/OBG family)
MRLNVSEDDSATGNDWVESVRQIAEQEQAKVVIVSAQVESELVELSEEERKDFLGSLGVEEGGLKSLIKATYELLGLAYLSHDRPQETPRMDDYFWYESTPGSRSYSLGF